MLLPKTDLGGHVVVKAACSQVDASGDTIILTAGATEDGVKIEGETIDRLYFDSCIFSLGAVATLADTKTLAFAVEYQTSADGSTWDTAVALQASTVLITATSATTFHGSLKLALKLGQDNTMKRYIRFNVTPDLSATGTDTAIWSATCVLAGDDRLPAA